MKKHIYSLAVLVCTLSTRREDIPRPMPSVLPLIRKQDIWHKLF